MGTTKLVYVYLERYLMFRDSKLAFISVVC
jgi:hypothetical protein